MRATHLVGTLDVESLSGPIAKIPSFDGAPFQLGPVDVIHINHEIAAAANQTTLPPSVHPSIPPHLSWLVYRVADSDFGPFHLAQTRIGCRIGLKPRGLLLSAVCDSPAAAAALEAGWGFTIQPGQVTIRSRNDEVAVRVSVGGTEILAVDIVNPSILEGASVPIAPGLNLADTPSGRRLVQVDPEYLIANAKRGRPKVRHFDAAAWGNPAVIPTWPISGSILEAEVSLLRLRYVIDPTSELAEGTVRLPDA